MFVGRTLDSVSTITIDTPKQNKSFLPFGVYYFHDRKVFAESIVLDLSRVTSCQNHLFASPCTVVFRPKNVEGAKMSQNHCCKQRHALPKCSVTTSKNLSRPSTCKQHVFARMRIGLINVVGWSLAHYTDRYPSVSSQPYFCLNAMKP